MFLSFCIFVVSKQTWCLMPTKKHFCCWVCTGSSVWWAPSHAEEEMEGGGVVIYGDNTVFLSFCVSVVCTLGA